MAASVKEIDHAEPLQTSTPVAALGSQNSAPTPEMEQPVKTAASDSTSSSTPQAPELPTEPGYTMSSTTTEKAADSQAWASIQFSNGPSPQKRH